MTILKQARVKAKCDCGRTVDPGSVFCPLCRAAINRQNAITFAREEKKYQQQMRIRLRKKY